jgi:ribosome maturation factor RimP
LHRKEIQTKGTKTFPSSFVMNQDTSITAIEGLIQQILNEGEDIFIVSVKIKLTNNIKVFLDADNGLSIEKCIRINRALYKLIEEKQWYPDGDFSLEVSSPGVDEPLKLFRQYKKNIGRNIEATLNNDTRHEGKLLEATEEEIKIELQEGKGKKASTKIIAIPFIEIKQTKVLIAF